MPERPQPHPPAEADALRTRYRFLHKFGVTTDLEALDWALVHSELDRLGYVLNDDKSDWVLASDTD